jgi:hypothetical protein
MVVTGYNAAGTVVAQQLAPVGGGTANPYHFEINSGGYDIVRFVVQSPAIGTGYDNVSYTVLPEPGVGLVGVGAVVGAVGGRRRGRRG